MSIIEKGGLVPEHKKIVFLGDSITDDGRYIAHIDYYLKKHLPDHIIELINLGLNSETASGLSEPDHPFPRPCIFDRIDRALEMTKPDWVVVCYGINDGIYYPYSEERMAAYQHGILNLIKKIKARGAKVIVMTPPILDVVSFGGPLLDENAEKFSWAQAYRNYNDVMKQYADWVMTDLRGVADRVVNIYGAMTAEYSAKRKDDPDLKMGDGIHPDLWGHWVIAKCLLGELFRLYPEYEPAYIKEETPAFGLVLKRHRLMSASWKEGVGHPHPDKAKNALPLDEAKAAAAELDKEIRKAIINEENDDRVEDWNGCVCRRFYYNGRVCTYIEPKQFAPGRPWVWRTEFLHAFESVDVELVRRGWALCYYRVSNLYGCPESVELMKGFHDEMVKRFGLSKTAVPFGFSRGGLYAVNYAAAYPQDVEAVYIDAPVLDLKSWPGGMGSGNSSPYELIDCMDVYGLDETGFRQFSQNPLDKAAVLAKAGIPIALVTGDADMSVPYDENGKLFDEKYRQAGGKILTIVKPGCAHHPHSLEDPAPVVDFLLKETGRN
ncbi:MAG TPA: GDSL-type esterase/lipase family protein [Oscillospiraceae bacterium]|nr:GDSL-type esterase/lipase family protein [Oscillospiraceae bacterium]HPF55658.1 GDSL-type esterase/lipase family protein [Clostridiales bacterium]HPK34724.1 GDSL-type esterase/lipase family protein [Oscillospiraceae bacterium]HPR76056.1 GDSL-type esterase/lipase family protein [Oscillospiraceae bacterium]